MRGKHGVSMQGIEYAPKKKGNVKCCECKHLIFKATGKNKGTRSDVCSHWCEAKKQARWYTSQCYCRQFCPKCEPVVNDKVAIILQGRAEQVREEKRRRKAEKRKKRTTIHQPTE